LKVNQQYKASVHAATGSWLEKACENVCSTQMNFPGSITAYERGSHTPRTTPLFLHDTKVPGAHLRWGLGLQKSLVFKRTKSLSADGLGVSAEPFPASVYVATKAEVQTTTRTIQGAAGLGGDDRDTAVFTVTTQTVKAQQCATTSKNWKASPWGCLLPFNKTTPPTTHSQNASRIAT